MQQTLTGCRFCEAPPSADLGEARTWGHDDPVTHPICADCASGGRRSRRARAPPLRWCGLVVDTDAALTRFRIELGHLEDTLQFCEQCSPDGLATYWTRDLSDHVVSE